MNGVIPKGKVAEYLFAAALMERAMLPCWPSSEGQPYDMIVDTVNGCQRVQVKSTALAPVKGRLSTSFTMESEGRRRRYSKKDTDFIALYLFFNQTWYIFPIEEVPRKVTIRPGSDKCKCEFYLNAWEFLSNPVVAKKRKFKGFADDL